MVAIDGLTLTHVFNDAAMERRFFAMIEQSASVIFCRLTPNQKAQITGLTKRIMHKRIVAIGDGYNDTPMI